MGRRTHHYCALRTPREPVNEFGTIWGTAWCGKPSANVNVKSVPEGEDPLAHSRRMATCPKCSAAIGKVRMTQISDRVQVVSGEMPTYSYSENANKFKSWNKVIIDGKHVGFIIMNNGWGEPWALARLPERGDSDHGGWVSTMSRRSDVQRHPTVMFQPVHHASKDMMASAALKAREAGLLLTVEERLEQRERQRQEQDARDAERDRERAAAAAERERKQALRDERKTLALEALQSVLCRMSALDLSNSEIMGLESARDIIHGKDVA